MTIARLRQREPRSVVCSAKTGDGIAEARAAIEGDLPRPAVEVHVLLPYDRGDLVSKIHDSGEVLDTDHTGDGTVVRARVSEALAGELEPYATERGRDELARSRAERGSVEERSDDHAVATSAADGD
jgi:GTP-binding protein HflX